LSPKGGGEPTGELANTISQQFSSFAQFREKFTNAAVTLFGSGWAWLVRNADGSLSVEATSNAGNPLKDGKKPLLTCDIWERAYYIDYRNARAKYVEAFWKLVNWDFATKNLKWQLCFSPNRPWANSDKIEEGTWTQRCKSNIENLCGNDKIVHA